MWGPPRWLVDAIEMHVAEEQFVVRMVAMGAPKAAAEKVMRLAKEDSRTTSFSYRQLFDLYTREAEAAVARGEQLLPS